MFSLSLLFPPAKFIIFFDLPGCLTSNRVEGRAGFLRNKIFKSKTGLIPVVDLEACDLAEHHGTSLA